MRANSIACRTYNGLVHLFVQFVMVSCLATIWAEIVRGDGIFFCAVFGTATHWLQDPFTVTVDQWLKLLSVCLVLVCFVIGGELRMFTQHASPDFIA
jgi:hypothetical protein